MPDRGLKTAPFSATLLSRGKEETFRLGSVFGKTATGGEVIALSGDLGTGKTQFVKGLAEGLGLDHRTVSSPTYLLVHCHLGRLSLSHIDLYRLDSPDEIGAFGLEEYFEGKGVVAVEWAEKGRSILPAERLDMEIKYLKADQRKMTLKSTDKRHQDWLERVQKVFPAMDITG